jgi:transposase InsO family protein
MERNLIGELNIMKEMGSRPNFSEVARRYGVDRHTVAKYWNGGGPQPDDGRSGRASGFDPYAAEIEGRAQLPGVTAKGIHEWLLDRHAGAEPPLPGYNALTHWLRTRGVELGVAVDAEPHPRFETAPGEQLQFDWKEDLLMHGRRGDAYEFNVYSATLGYSRRHLFRRANDRTRDTLLRCLYATIVAINGVPRAFVTDNMSAVATIGGDGTRRRDPRVERFAREAGFELVLARPRSPQTKGKDESANRFLSRLAAYEGDFDGWEELDRIIARIERRSNEEPNGTTGLPPALLFARGEKDALRPAGNLALLESMLGDVTRQTVPPTMLVRAAGREWSVPRRCIGREVRCVLQPGGGLLVFDGDALVASHDTTAPAKPINYDPAHYAEAMGGKRWGGADSDIEEAARRNLELLDGLGSL